MKVIFGYLSFLNPFFILDTDDVRFMKSDVIQIKEALSENAEAVDEMKKSLNNVNLQLKRIRELLTNDSTKGIT